jgi:hypothetical protein
MHIHTSPPARRPWCRLTRARQAAQRSFEERLGRQLGEMEAAIRRDISLRTRRLEAKLGELADLVASSGAGRGRAKEEDGPPGDAHGGVGHDLGPSCDSGGCVEEKQAARPSRDPGRSREC